MTRRRPIDTDRAERTATSRASGAGLRAHAAGISNERAEARADFAPVTKVDSRTLLALVRLAQRAQAAKGAPDSAALTELARTAERTIERERVRAKRMIALDERGGATGAAVLPPG